MNGYMERKVMEITELYAELNKGSLRGALYRSRHKYSSKKISPYRV